jgi:hypothetical protein
MPEAPDGVVTGSGRTLWIWEVWGGGADAGEEVVAQQLSFEPDGALAFESMERDARGRSTLVVIRAFARRGWATVKLKGSRFEPITK